MKKTFAHFMASMLVTAAPLQAQQTPYTGKRTFTARQLQSDFDILTSSIQTYHPSPHRYITADSLNGFAASVKSRIRDGMTDNEFHLLAREYLAQVKCGHTVARPSNEWYSWIGNNTRFFPFKIGIINGRIFVKETYAPETGITPGTEILAIDSIPTSTILQQIAAIQPRDGFGTSFVHYSTENTFSTYYIFLYGPRQDYLVTWKNKTGETVNTRVTGYQRGTVKEKVNYPDSTRFTKQISCTWSTLYFYSDKKTALLDIDNFGNKKRKKYYKKAFGEIKRNGIQHLIIDLRDNGGGYFPNGTRLLRHLSPERFTFDFNRPKGKLKKQEYLRMNFFSRMTKGFLFRLIRDPAKKNGVRDYQVKYKPFKKTHYNGSLYVLTNGGSFSMSGYTAAFLKHRLNAVVIGQETGGGEEGSRAILGYTLTLPQTRIVVNVPYYNLDHKLPGASRGRGVIPANEIKYSPEDLLQEKDREMEAALKIIVDK